jgi:phosphonate transport system substrate-binding protein
MQPLISQQKSNPDRRATLRIRSRIYVILVVSILCAFFSKLAFSEDLPNKTYTVGVVPQFEVRKLYAIWQPIIEDIEDRTGLRLELSPSAHIQKFELELTQGKFDFAYMNPYHMLVAYQSGYEPLLRDTSKKLKGILVVRNDSKITTPYDLQGKTIAFPSPNALGASLQMRQELLDLFQVRAKPIFVKTHDSVYLNVILGDASAGGGVQKTLSRQRVAYKEKLRTIHSTTPVAPHPIAARKDLPTHIKETLSRAFLEMGQSIDGQAKLAKVPINTIGLAEISDYLPLKAMGLDRFYFKPENE